MWHGFQPGGIQPGGGLALPAPTCPKEYCIFNKVMIYKWVSECLSPAFLKDAKLIQ